MKGDTPGPLGDAQPQAPYRASDCVKQITAVSFEQAVEGEVTMADVKVRIAFAFLHPPS